MLQKLAFFIAIQFFISQTAWAAISGQCINDKGKFSDCTIENKDGTLEIRYKLKSLAHLNKEIPGEKITKLTGGEYSRRRVLESIALGVALTPLALFGLFSKKQRDTFGVEYLNSNEKPDATLISTKKKYGMAVKGLLQSISGKSVEYDEMKKDGKK